MKAFKLRIKNRMIDAAGNFSLRHSMLVRRHVVDSAECYEEIFIEFSDTRSSFLGQFRQKRQIVYS